MSETKWQKRKPLRLECPSGSVCYAQRPSPEISLKGGKLAHIFAAPVAALNPQAVINELSDEDAAKVYLFARELVATVVVEPKISLDRGGEGLTPEDVPPPDFWYVFSWAMRGGPGLPVALEEGETTVEAVETFPSEPGRLNIPRSNSEQVSQVSV